MPLINYEISLDLNWSDKCAIGVSNANEDNIFNNWYKTFVPVVTLSTKDNTKLLEQSKSGFKRTINWNIYQPKD